MLSAVADTDTGPMRGVRVGLAGVALALCGCGNVIDVEVGGATAVTLDDRGVPVVLVQMCAGEIDNVHLSATREGLADDEPNETLGEWQTDSAVAGAIEVSLAGATPGWTGPSVAVQPDSSYIVSASDSNSNFVATQATFSTDDLNSLGVDQVIAGDSDMMTRTEFEAEACP